MSEFLHRLNYTFNVIFIICLVLWLETIVVETPRVPVIIFFSVLAAISWVFSWMPGTITIFTISEDLYFFQWQGGWEIAGMILGWSANIYLLFYFVKICLKAPSGLQKRIAFYIVGVLQSWFVGDLVEQGTRNLHWAFSETGITFLYILRGFFNALAMVLWFLLLYLHPEVTTLLTFQAYRLIVVQQDSGIPIFQHVWKHPGEVKSEDDDEVLFAGLLQALQSLSFEVLRLGEMRAVNMRNGVLLFHQGKYVTAGISAETSTRFLQEKLGQVVDMFETRFQSELQKLSTNLAVFQEATAMVDEIFKLVPVKRRGVS